MKPTSPLVASLFANRVLAGLIVGLIAAIALINAWLFAHPQWERIRGITDFQDFYVAGKLVLSGQARCAYEWPCLRHGQLAEFGRWEFMPWSYPPQFTVLVAGLAVLPHAVAFLVFSLGSFTFLVWMVVKLSGRYAAFPLVLILPAAIVNARCGQNGFLTAGLIALFAWLYLRRDDRCGLALGAMVIKPHLALALGLLLLLRRQWLAAAQAIAVVAGTAALATVVLGPGIWPAFVRASSESGQHLWNGEFPLERMTSVFALFRQAGVSSPLAMGAQLIAALGLLAGLATLASQCRDERIVVAAAVAATLMLSPYTYDYDLPIAGVALALIAPIVLERLSGLEALAAGTLSWLASANFLIIYLAFELVPGLTHHKQVWSVSALCTFGLGWTLARALGRTGDTPEAQASLGIASPA